MAGKPKDLTGQRFGSLVARQPNHKGPDGTAFWLFQCDCGNQHIARGNTVSHQAKKGDPELPSCGCIELARKTKHGLRTVAVTHPIYRAYRGMMTRCYNPNDNGYQFYGAKGVTVCPEWYENPEAFIQWALSSGWFKGAHIDKDILCDALDVHPHIYSPDTCQWIDAKKNVGYATNRDNFGSHPNVKLSHQQVAEILLRLNQGEDRHSLAAQFKVHESSIRRLVKLSEV